MNAIALLLLKDGTEARARALSGIELQTVIWLYFSKAIMMRGESSKSKEKEGKRRVKEAKTGA